MFAAFIAIPFTALSSTAQTPISGGVGQYPIDASGKCIYPRDFSRVSIESRTRVEGFWNGTVNAHRISQQAIRDATFAEMRRNGVDRKTGLSDEQQQLRERISADGWARERQDHAIYRQEYDTFISSLPASDRDAAARAVASVVMPVDPNCPKGFQVNPMM